MVSAQAPTARSGFAIVDVETTGLDPHKHRVIEIACTLMDITGVVTQEWSTLVKVRGETGPVHIHGLTAHHLAQAPTFAEVADELSNLLAGRILVAHNATFDWTFLSHEAARVGIALPVSERLCTVNLARALAIETENYKLATLAEHWGIDVGVSHRASDDVATLVGVLRHCLNEAGRQGFPLGLEKCTPPTGFTWVARRRIAHVVRLAHPSGAGKSGRTALGRQTD